MGYGGLNESMHTNNMYYWVREGKGSTWRQPVLRLKTVCWMNPYSVIENIPLPNKQHNVLSLFFYHKYGDEFDFHSTDLIIYFAKHTKSKPEWGAAHKLQSFPHNTN
jgi:hypothetical protein